MTILVDKHNLYNTFKVECFNELESSINNTSPSMTEYYLDDLANSSDESMLHLNKTNVEQSILLDNYYIYLDYSQNVFLEINKDMDDELETGSLW